MSKSRLLTPVMYATVYIIYVYRNSENTLTKSKISSRTTDQFQPNLAKTWHCLGEGDSSDMLFSKGRYNSEIAKIYIIDNIKYFSRTMHVHWINSTTLSAKHPCVREIRGFTYKDHSIFNKRPNRPHCSPEQQFQSINTFAQSNDYAITLREKNHYLLFENWMVD